MSSALLVSLVVGWFCGAGLNFAIAKANGRDANGAAAASLVFSPVLVFLYLVATPKPAARQPSQPGYLRDR
jgi:hypothetical protein